MAQLRLTKKGLVILIFILSFVFFSIGFGLWQLTGTKTFQPTDSSAGATGVPAGCNCNYNELQNVGGCEGGLQNVKCPGDNVACGNKVCSGYGRYQCCDGKWVIETTANGGEYACKFHGGYGNCQGPTAQKCYCQSYGGCGVNCVFPAGTQKKVDAKAAGTCSQYIAMCNRDTAGRTTISIEKFGPSHKCWGQENICKNPVGGEECANVCDGGAVSAPANNTEYKVGDVVKIKGYAFDKNGINKSTIVVKVDGAKVGNATATNHACPAGSTDPKCVAAKGAPVIDWTYSYTVTKAGNHTITVAWSDTLGKTGTKCTGTRTIVASTVVQNRCEGGEVTKPTILDGYEVGNVVQIAGYAFDKDGINPNTVQVYINDVKVGLATVTNHSCPTGSTDPICVDANGSPAVDWKYSYTITKTGTIKIMVKWFDKTGLTGVNCNGTRTITSSLQGTPAWTITKTGAAVCIDETVGSQKSRIDYTIVIKNVGDLGGQLEDLVDKLDSKVETSYIQTSTIDPDGTVSGGDTITWNLSGTDGYFTPQHSKTYKYSIVVPQAAFGQYTNTATATPESGSAVVATEQVYTACDGTEPPPETPETGLFDSVVAKVILGAFLVLASATYLYSDKASVVIKRGKKSVKERFEEKIVAGK